MTADEVVREVHRGRCLVTGCYYGLATCSDSCVFCGVRRPPSPLGKSPVATQTIRPGDRMQISVELLKDWVAEPSLRTVQVEVVEVRTEEDGSKTPVLRRLLCPLIGIDEHQCTPSCVGYHPPLGLEW